jgi:hypothetical protein
MFSLVAIIKIVAQGANLSLSLLLSPAHQAGTTLTTTLDRFVFRRMKKQSVRDAKCKAAKLGQAVQKFAVNVEKEEQRRLAGIKQERMRALKDNDEEAYMRFIDEAKDMRITTILSQTTEYLSSLTDAVVNQKGRVSGQIRPCTSRCVCARACAHSSCMSLLFLLFSHNRFKH